VAFNLSAAEDTAAATLQWGVVRGVKCASALALVYLSLDTQAHAGSHAHIDAHSLARTLAPLRRAPGLSGAARGRGGRRRGAGALSD
jgi:hypothetical protein